MKKKISDLIDELAITNVKIALMLEKPFTNADQANRVQELNKYRVKLKNAISDWFEEEKELKAYD